MSNLVCDMLELVIDAFGEPDEFKTFLPPPSPYGKPAERARTLFSVKTRGSEKSRP
jgi:hypothetical protein